jgi:hypothetical protein
LYRRANELGVFFSTSSLHSFLTILDPARSEQLFHRNSKKMHSTSFIAFLAALPATLACLAETTLPASTGSKSLSEPQYIASGETFDGEYVKAS